MNRVWMALAATATVAALLTGCSGGSNNDGGDTTCKEFLPMSTDDKDATVAKMLKERNAKNSSTSDVELKRQALVLICQAPDKTDTKISELQ